MNGIEKIIARLESDTQAEIDALNAETAETCETIRADYAQQAQTAYEKRRREGAEACALRKERLDSTAEMEARKSVLAFKQEAVTATFAEAAARIARLPKPEYTAFLAAQAAKAATYGTEELIFSAADAAAVGREVVKAANALLQQRGVNGGLTLSDTVRDIPGGLIVKQGDIEVNCAVDTLVQLSRNALASQVAEILFT